MTHYSIAFSEVKSLIFKRLITDFIETKFKYTVRDPNLSSTDRLLYQTTDRRGRWSRRWRGCHFSLSECLNTVVILKATHTFTNFSVKQSSKANSGTFSPEDCDALQRMTPAAPVKWMDSACSTAASYNEPVCLQGASRPASPASRGVGVGVGSGEGAQVNNPSVGKQR